MRGLTRRSCLLLGGGVLLSSVGCAPEPEWRWDVAVVGAGMAGLASARNLADQGLSVIVLEARDRIGGQLYTDHGFTSVPIELGAGLLHGTDASTWELVGEADVDTARLRSEAYGSPRIDVSAGPRESENAAEYLRRLGVPEQDWPPVDIDSERLGRWSATWMHDNGFFEWWSDEREDFRVVGGYDQLLSPVAYKLRVDLGNAVRRVRWSASGVELAVTTPEGGTEVRAARCLIALPIGVLKAGDVQFEPELPASHRDAVDALDATDATKLVYEFDRPVFPEGADTLPWNQDSEFEFWCVSHGDPEVVVVWAAGESARSLLAMDPEDRFTAGLHALGEALGDTRLEPVRRTTHDWTGDEFSRGAYLFVPPGAHDAPAALGAPVDRVLFFAGEATKGENTVDGAYDSGYAVTDDLMSDVDPDSSGR